MPYITEYCILTDDRASLAPAVNKLITEGWQPFGPPQLAANDHAAYVIQAMVKYAPVRTEYDLVTAYHPNDLFDAMNDRIEQGFRPCGSLAVTSAAAGDLYAQPILRQTPEAI